MKDMNTFYAIPKFKNYSINRLGEVLDVINGKKVEPLKNSEKTRYVIIDDSKIEIARLLLLRFYGDDNEKFNVYYKYSKKEYDIDSITYEIIQKEVLDNNTLFINGVEFKRYKNSDYYFSKKGLIYNNTRSAFSSVSITKK